MRISAFEADKGYPTYQVNADGGHFHHIYVDGVFYENAVVADDVLGYALLAYGGGDEGEFLMTIVYGDVKIERVKRKTNE